MSFPTILHRPLPWVGQRLSRVFFLLFMAHPFQSWIQARESSDGISSLNIPIETGANALPVLRIGSPSRRLATQNGERIQFPVHLTRATDQAVILDYHTTNRTAISGRDYVATSGRITLPPGTTEALVEIELLPGEDPGRDLWFQLIGSTPRFSPPRVIQPAVSGVGTLQTHVTFQGVSGFQWTSLPTRTAPGASVQVGIQALDPLLKPSAAAGSRVKISAYPGSGRPHPIVLSTVNVLSREVLIHSTVDREISLEGWSLHLYDEQSWPHPGVTWIGGPTNILQPFHFLTIQSESVGSVLSSLRWASGNSGLGLNRPVAALLQDPAGNAVDFFSVGGARSIDMKYPIRLIPEEWPGFENGNRPQPWSGGSAGGTGIFPHSFNVFARVGAMTRGAADEWLLGRLPSIPTNSLAHALHLPWRQSSAEPLALGEVELDSGGSWQGTLTLPTAAGPWILVAEAGNGRRTFSPVIQIGSGGDLGIVRFDIGPAMEARSSYPRRWSMTISNGSPNLATGVVARLRHARVPIHEFHSWVTKPGASVVRVEADTLHGPHVEARLGNLGPGEFVDLGGNFVGFHAVSSALLFAATVAGESGDTDAADNFQSEIIYAITTSIPNASGFVWSGDDGGNSLDGNRPLTLVGDISFVPRLGRPAFRVGTNSWIELPGDLGAIWSTPTNGSLSFLFRLPAGDRRSETMTLISRDDPSNQENSYRLDIEAGTMLAYLGGTRLGGQIQDQARTWDQPIDFRDGEWHSVQLSRTRSSVSGAISFLITIDGSHFWIVNTAADFPVAGTGLPIRIGGGPGQTSLDCVIDDIELSTRGVPTLGASRFFRKAHIDLTYDLSQPFIGLDSATAGRPFTLNFKFSNAGPFTSEPVIARIFHPTNWTLLSATYPGGGRMFEFWAGVHTELGTLAPDQATRLTLTYVAPAGSNNLFIEASLPAFDSASPALTIPIVIDADSDRDGLPDAWETTFGLSAKNPGDTRLDLDLDGIDALGEFEAGTDPDDPESVLAIRWSADPDGRWKLRIDSQLGRTYHLDRNPESGLGSVWEPAGEFAGTGETLELGVLEPDIAHSRLYRVRVRRDR
jgi:hypothetical protein